MRFRVSFTIPQALLSTIVQVLTDEVGDLRIEQDEEGDAPPPRPPRQPQMQASRPIIRRMGAEMDSFILDFMSKSRGRTVSLSKIQLAAEKAGFNPNSVSPANTELVRKGQLERVDRGQYRAVVLEEKTAD